MKKCADVADSASASDPICSVPLQGFVRIRQTRMWARFPLVCSGMCSGTRRCVHLVNPDVHELGLRETGCRDKSSFPTL